jgi:nucleotide-binding universal stress UspA family protein
MTSVQAGPVVVGVDYSGRSDSAIACAAWEADRRGLSLLLVHGYLVPTPYLTPLAPLYDDELLVAAAEQGLTGAAAVVRRRYPKLPIAIKVVRGSGGAALIAESASASLLVVGPRGSGGFTGLLLGSVAGQVAAYAHCPVIVQRGPDRDGPAPPDRGPVLVGVDGSSGSAAGLSFGFEEAAGRDVALIGVHVWSVPELSGLTAGLHWAEDPLLAQTQMQETAQRVLAEAMAGWQEQYPQVTIKRSTVHSFAPARILLEAAEEFSAALLVVGSRGHGGFAGMLLGSVGQTLVNQAKIPVAIVHGDLRDL